MTITGSNRKSRVHRFNTSKALEDDMANASGTSLGVKLMKSIVAVLMLFAIGLGMSEPGTAQNLIVNPGFESNPPTAMGNNGNHPITPWNLTGGNSPNVVRVDGPGGYNYGTNGPESDATAPGAGVPQHYLDIIGSNDFFQSFQVPTCPAGLPGDTVTVNFSGRFSTRANSSGVGSIALRNGMGQSGTVIAIQQVNLPAGNSQFTPWFTAGGTAQVQRGTTFTFIASMNNQLNFDDAVVEIQNDACLGSVTIRKTLTAPAGITVTAVDFPVTVNCGAPMTGTISVNTPWTINNLPTATSCTVTEAPAPTAGVCPDGLMASWTNPPSPQTVLPTPAGAEVIINNTLQCEPTRVDFVKKVINNTPADLSGLTFTINPNCQGSNGTPATLSLQDTQNASVPVMLGSTCTPTEATPGFTTDAEKYCASKGLIPTWSTVVVPQASQTITGSGMGFGIENTFGCTEPPLIKVEVVKKVVNTTPAILSDLFYSINTNCSGNSGAPSTVSLQDGQSTAISVLQGSTCALTENLPGFTADAEKYCASLGLIPNWTTSILPQSFVVPANGGVITVENTFSCVKPKQVKVSFNKKVINQTSVDLSNLTYDINTNCSASSATPAIVTLQDGLTVTKPVMQGSICSPTEVPPAITADMEKYCAEQGLVPTWSTQIIPAGSVTIGASSTSFTAENTFSCTKAEIGDVKITKVCDPVTPGQTNGTSGGFHTVCHITVTTNGPIPNPGLTVGDVVQPINVVPAMAQASGPAWTCSGGSCSATPAVLGNSSVSVFDTYIDFANAGAVAEQHNCASTTGAIKSEACSKFELNKELTGFSVTKRVVSNAPDVFPSVPFPITATCDGAVSSISDGQTIAINNLVAGTACTVQEGNLTTGIVNHAALDACSGAGQPVWTTSYSPSQTVNAAPDAAVTITNTLNCVPVVKGFTVKKVLVSNAPGSVAGLTFPITSTCGPNTPNSNSPMTVNMAAGTPGIIFGGAVGDTCTITETAYPATNACGTDALPVWTQSISPSTFTVGNTNPIVTVTNTLDCKKIDPPVRQIFVKKVVVNNAPGSVAGLSFPITSTCGPNTTSAHSPMTVGYSDGLTTIFGGVQGDTCTISETSYPVTNACGDQTPVWSTVISPSPTLTVAANNPLITVINTLNCKPPEGRLTVKKIVIKPQGANIPNTMTFPVQVNCGSPQTGTMSVNASWSLNNLSTNTACTVSENVSALPVTGVCPPGQVASWTVNPSPSQTVTPTLAGATVTFTNRLSCKDNPPDGPAKIEFTKKVINNTPADLSGLTYTINSNCPGSNATPSTIQLQDAQTVTVPVALGSTCTPTEVTPGFTADAEKYCAARGLVPHWSTTVVPQQSLTVTSAGGAFAFENTFDCEKPEEVKIEITKSVRNSTPADLTGLVFDISPNCSPTAASPALVQLTDGGATSFVTATGSTCTPSEATPGFTADAKKYCESRGLVPTWSTQVLPQPSVTVDSSGTTITVENTFTCEKPKEGGSTPPVLNVTKSCVVYQQMTDALAILDCTITVTASGSPLPPVISVTENLQSTNAVPNSYLALMGIVSSDPGWTCPPGGTMIQPNTPLTCTIPGPNFPTSGTSTLHAYVFADANITPGSTQNCVTASGNSVPPVSGGPACVPIGTGLPEWGILKVMKEATLNGQNLPQQSFPMTVTCGSNVTNISVLNDGPAVAVNNIPFGTACSVTEPTPTIAGVCPEGETANWNITYSPAVSQPFTAQNANQTITVKNVLTCRPIIVPPPGRLTVKKVVQYNGPPGPNLNTVNFPVTVTCGGTTTNGNISVNTPMSMNGLSTSTNCTVVEGTPPITGVCPRSQTASWTVSPPSQSVTPTIGGAVATITNTLNCVTPSVYINVAKITKDANGVLFPWNIAANMAFPYTVTCGGNSNSSTIVGNGHGWGNIQYVPGVPCTVTEAVTTPAASLCPTGQIASWQTSYTPPTPVLPGPCVIVGNGPGCSPPTLTIENKLVCSPPVPTTGTLSVTKTCAPATFSPNGGVDVQCNITANVTGGPAPAVITLTEKLDELITMNPGAGQITSLTSAQPWTFPSLPINSGATAPITLNGSAMPTSGTSTITVGMHFADVAMLSEMQNCVSGTGGPSTAVITTTAPQICVPFQAPITTPSTFDLNVEKTCKPFVMFDFYGLGSFGAYSGYAPSPPQWWQVDPATEAIYICKIMVTTTGGPVPPTISVSDIFQSTMPNAVQSMQLLGVAPFGTGANDPWVCPVPTPGITVYPPNVPVTCTIQGASFPADGTSELTSMVKITSPVSGGTIENCASASANSSPAVSAGPSCVTLQPPPLPGAVLTVQKVLTKNGLPYTLPTGHSGPWFRMQATCGQATANFGLFAGSSIPIKNIVPGTNCTVVEGNSNSNVTGNWSNICPSGHIETYTTTYSPSATVTVPASGATVTVTNDLTCVEAPPPKGSITVHKYLNDFDGNLMSTQQSQNFSFQMTLTCGTEVRQFSMNGNADHTESNLLTSVGCTVAETPPAPPSSSFCPTGHTPSWDIQYFNLSPVNPSAATPNQAILWVRNRVQCTPPSTGASTTGSLTVKKVATLNGQNLPPQAYPMTVTCGSTVTNVAVTPGATPATVSGIPLGTSCTVVEPPASTVGLCPTGKTASWVTSYSPSQAVVISQPTEAITVSNILSCTSRFIDAGVATVLPDSIRPTPVEPQLIVSKTCQPPVPVSGTNKVRVSCTVLLTQFGDEEYSNINLSDKVVPVVPGALVVQVNSSVPALAFPSAWLPAGPIGISIGTNPTGTNDTSSFYSSGQHASVEIVWEFPSADGLESRNNCVQAFVSQPNEPIGLSTGPDLCVPLVALPETAPVDSPQCANSTVKLANGKCGAPPPPALKCDRETTKLVDGQCLCTIRGMKPWSKTECRCQKGQEVRNGQCRDIPPPPPPAPKCDTRSAELQDGKCVCKVPGAVPVSKTACGCPDGTELIKGKCRVPPPEVKCDPRSAVPSNGKCVCKIPGAVPVSPTACGCPDGTELIKGKCRVPAPVLKCDRDTTVAKGDSCVCKFRGMRPVSETECACRRGSTFVPGKGCVVERADCPEGTVRKGDLCIRLKLDEPRGKDCPPGTRKVGPLCVRVKLKDADPAPENPAGPGKLCLDREGKEVPCD